MKTTKCKWLAILLILALSLPGFVGCSSGKSEVSKETSTSATMDSTPTPEDKPDSLDDDNGNTESEEMYEYSTASLSIDAPADWIEQLNKTDYGTEMWRLVSGEDWQDNLEAKTISISYRAEGDDDFEGTVKSLQFSYPDLQETGEVTIGGKVWRHFSATQNREEESIIYSSYFGEIGGRQLLADFKGIAADDRIIEAVLSGIKTK